MIGIANRHIILSLLLACLMAACSSQEPQDQPGSSSMEFSVELKSSRTEVTNSNNLSAYPFAVYSDMISMDRTSETPYIPVHKGTAVSYNKTTKKWSYDDTQYWFPGFQYAFVAFHPAGPLNMCDINYADNTFTLTYTQPSNYKSARDLLISAHRRDYAGGDAEAVCFSFEHILTNIQVKVAYNCYSTGPKKVTINSLTIKNTPVKSKYSIKPAPLTGGSTMTSDWIVDDGSLEGWTVQRMDDVRVLFQGREARVIEVNKGPFALFTDSDALLLLPNPYDPEEDPDDQPEFELNYTTDQGETETVEAVIPRGWAPGTNLTLSLEINNGIVQVAVEVEDWNEGTTTNTTVPRK